MLLRQLGGSVFEQLWHLLRRVGVSFSPELSVYEITPSKTVAGTWNGGEGVPELLLDLE